MHVTPGDDIHRLYFGKSPDNLTNMIEYWDAGYDSAHGKISIYHDTVYFYQVIKANHPMYRANIGRVTDDCPRN